ncbi:MAG: hypothetical protein M3393_03755 [Actinomycetota bacterium]|nr:hypothetical protein [Actinomycetota bacterium]
MSKNVPRKELAGSLGSKGRDLLVGQSQVQIQWPVEGDGLVRPDLVVLEPVLRGVFGEHDGVIDLVDEQALVLEGVEAAFA